LSQHLREVEYSTFGISSYIRFASDPDDSSGIITVMTLRVPEAYGEFHDCALDFLKASDSGNLTIEVRFPITCKTIQVNQVGDKSMFTGYDDRKWPELISNNVDWVKTGRGGSAAASDMEDAVASVEPSA